MTKEDIKKAMRDTKREVVIKNLHKLLSSVEGYPEYEDCITYAITELEQELIDYKAQYEEFSKKAEIVISQLREDRDRLLNVFNEIRDDIECTLYVDSLIFTELYDFKNGKIDVDDVIEEFNRVTRAEVLKIIDKYKTESEE